MLLFWCSFFFPDTASVHSHPANPAKHRKNEKKRRNTLSPVHWVENRDKSRKSTKLGTNVPYGIKNKFRRVAT